MFKKYKNKKVIEKSYKNSMDSEWYIPSIKKLMIETEFLIAQTVESYKIDYTSHNLDPVEQLKEDMVHISRNCLIKALIATGKGTNP